jgi:spore maturation protein A
MMNWLWAIMMLGSIVCAAFTGRLDAIFGAAMDGAGAAVQLFVTLLAVYALWCGVMEIIADSGLADKFASALRPLLRWLYPSVPSGSNASRQIAMNMAANMLGVGNAATPAGLEAIREMKEEALKKGDASVKQGEATNDMCMLLVINCSSIQLIPTTVIALRQAAGSLSPADILAPSLIASVGAACFGVMTAKALAAWPRRRR